ncbi:4598_t:CDS:2, partial [Gigaspora rosea]
EFQKIKANLRNIWYNNYCHEQPYINEIIRFDNQSIKLKFK